MNRYLMLVLTLVLVSSLVAAPAAQADLVTLTIILATVWSSGVIVNETLIRNEDMGDQQRAQNDAEGSQLAVAAPQMDWFQNIEDQPHQH